jgi:glycosyltransferase involved in cell wall biosynthesis
MSSHLRTNVIESGVSRSDQPVSHKRVLFVLCLDPAGKFGSIEEQTLTLAREFRDKGSLFLPVFLRPLDAKSADQYAGEGLEAESLDLMHFRLATLRRLLRLVTQHRIEVVHWNFHHPVRNGYYWALSVLRPRVEHYFTDHVSRSGTVADLGRRGNFKSRVGYLLTPRYRKTLCVSDYVLARVREARGSRAERIHYFVNTERFRPDEGRRAELRAELGLNGEFVAIVVAQLIKDKGIDVALRAFADLPEDAVLWVVGAGPEGNSLKDLARNLGLGNRVRFFGPRRNVEPLMQAADCAICPSLWAEAAGLVNLEALATGLPIVASRIGGIPEFVEHGRTGLLFKAGNHSELTRCLRQFFEDPSLRRRMGQEARAIALERHSTRALLNEHLNLYRSAGVAPPIRETSLGSELRKLGTRSLDRWLGSYLIQSGSRLRRRCGPIHAIICIADHFEPRDGANSDEVARARVDAWVQKFPAKFREFRDSDGRAPRHTFFYPIEEYDPEQVEALAELCRAGYGEFELHLHHDNDTPENLRDTLLSAKALFADRHGLLARDRATGERVYGFIHGNWALDNSRPDGRWCGVNNELDVLRETGCYADFTFPSAPSPTQPRKINSIYYAVDDPHRPRSHDRGVDVGAGSMPEDALMLIQGPLVLDWRRARWGFLPRVENGCIQASQPPHIDRLALWLKAGIQVRSRPDWYFIKLHAHGAPEESHEALLGEPMAKFHRDLAERARRNPDFHYHYVTARETYNLVKAAEAGWAGTVAEARDYCIVAAPLRRVMSPLA